jgi:DNA-binding IclR family transcriptional regulator
VAWSDPVDQQAWLDRAPVKSRGRFAAVLQTIRDRGYAIERLTQTGLVVRRLLAEFGPSALAPGVDSVLARHMIDLTIGDYLPHELQTAIRHPVDMIAAPVFDLHGHVIMGLVAQIAAELTRLELDTIGAQLRRGARRIAALI